MLVAGLPNSAEACVFAAGSRMAAKRLHLINILAIWPAVEQRARK